MKKKLLSLLTLLLVALSVSAAPTAPKVSTAEATYWYMLQFLNGDGVLEAKTSGANVVIGVATGKPTQLWKIEGNATTGYTLTSKNGLTLYTSTTALNGMFQAGTTPNSNNHFVWQTTTAVGYTNEGWVLSPKANTSVYMNQWQGAKVGNNIGLWNDRSDKGQPFKFVEYDENTLSSVLPLIPYPQSVTKGEGSLSLKSITSVSADDAVASRYLSEFAAQLKKTASIDWTITDAAGENGLVMTTDASLAHEAYMLNVTATGITVTAADSAGFFYALQTLKQLMPHAIYGTANSPELDWSVPVVSITDQPQLGHRGYMLDVARHFFSKTEVKRILDVMASYKMNRFHWHLTDDQGWRIEIPEYPKLTTVGAIRKGSFVNAGGSSQFYDDTEYGRGMYFTLDDLREIVAYAKERNIEIIPEVDLPGHMVAAVTAYPEFSCDPTKSYEVRISGGISQDVLNIGKDEVVDFLKCVLGHVAEVFPYQYIHLGGDECPTTQWSTNAECLQRVKNEGLSGVNELQSWLVELLGTYLKEQYGKDIVVWDELLAHWNSDNKVKPVIMAWNHINKSSEAANKGFKSIVVPYQSLYLDMMQVAVGQADVNEKYQGGWGDGYVNTVQTVYGVNPVASLSGREDYCLGVQGNMWTETCNDSVEVEYQLLPRLLALSETGWLPAAKKDFNNFYQRLQKNRDILDFKGLTYATHYFDDYRSNEEIVLDEAKSILDASKPGKVGYPSQEAYDALTAAYDAATAANATEETISSLTQAIATYKAAAITLPSEGTYYQLKSASTYYKAKYVGSTAYVNNGNVRFHYTPQVEPEELWQFKSVDGGYALVNVLTGEKVLLSATNATNTSFDTNGSVFTIALATQASGSYDYVPGAVTLAANGKYFTADCTGYVKSGDNPAICYPATWYIEEVEDYTAELSGLVKKGYYILNTVTPGEIGQPSEEALNFLSESIVTPAAEAVAAGSVTKETYQGFLDLYAEYLAMPVVSAIDAIDEGYCYYIRNAYFTQKYAKASTSNTVVPADKGTTEDYLWTFKKNANGTAVITNVKTKTPAYVPSDTENQTILLGQSYSWAFEQATSDGNTGTRILSNNGTYSWYSNPSAFQTILFKPKEWGGGIWLFEKTEILSGISTPVVKKNATTFYDLQGRPVANPKHGVFITNTGHKVVK